MGRRGTSKGYTQLLLRAQRGDACAFAELHAAMLPVVRDFIGSLDGRLHRQDRDELAHEALLAVWRKLSDYRGEASAKTFVLAIARNIALKHMSNRQRSRIVYTGNLSGMLGEREAYEDADSLSGEPFDTDSQIQQAMGKLTPAQRLAVELSLSHECRISAAEEAGCSPAQLADRLYHAKKRLRQALNGLRCILLL